MVGVLVLTLVATMVVRPGDDDRTIETAGITEKGVIEGSSFGAPVALTPRSTTTKESTTTSSSTTDASAGQVDITTTTDASTTTQPAPTSTTSTTAPRRTTTTAAPATTAPPRTTTTAAPTTTTAPPTTTTQPPTTTTEPPADETADDGEEYAYDDPRSTQVWYDLAECEAWGDWSLNTGNGYYGGLQFSKGSWDAVGGTGYPHEHPAGVQIDMGRRLQARQGWGAWPHCSQKLGLR